MSEERGNDWSYLTEQQMQPFPTSSHSSTSCPPWLTVIDFSMSTAGNGQHGTSHDLGKA
jgi:hypothetical protein